LWKNGRDQAVDGNSLYRYLLWRRWYSRGAEERAFAGVDPVIDKDLVSAAWRWRRIVTHLSSPPMCPVLPWILEHPKSVS